MINMKPICKQVIVLYTIFEYYFCAENNENYIYSCKNSTKIAATRAAPFDSNMHEIVCRLGLRPRPHWGSLQRSLRLPSCI